MAFRTLLCCGSIQFGKRKKTKTNSKAPYKKKFGKNGSKMSAVDDAEVRQADVLSTLVSAQENESSFPFINSLNRVGTVGEVVCASPTLLDIVPEEVTPHEIAESSEIVREESLISSILPDQLGSIIVDNSYAEIPVSFKGLTIETRVNYPETGSFDFTNMDNGSNVNKSDGISENSTESNRLTNTADDFVGMVALERSTNSKGDSSSAVENVGVTPNEVESVVESEILIAPEGSDYSVEVISPASACITSVPIDPSVVLEPVIPSNVNIEVATSVVNPKTAEVAMNNSHELSSMGSPSDEVCSTVSNADQALIDTSRTCGMRSIPGRFLYGSEEHPIECNVKKGSCENAHGNDKIPFSASISDVTNKVVHLPEISADESYQASVNSDSKMINSCNNLSRPAESTEMNSSVVDAERSHSNGTGGSLISFTGIFNDPENEIEEDSPEMCDGVLIPKVLVPEELLAQVFDDNLFVKSMDVPAHLGGVLIGRLGKNFRDMRSGHNADLTLSMNPDSQSSLLLKICCPLVNRDSVCKWINKRLQTRPSQTTIGNPNQLQRLLPLGKLSQVIVRSMYNQKEVFVTIKDAEYTRYLKMQDEMNNDYSSLNTHRMQLYEPVTTGTIAVLPHILGFSRVVILKIINTIPRYALCLLLDHGSFAIARITDLRKIKAKYMRIPFQAVHVSWAHAMPCFLDTPDLHILRTFFENKQVSVFPVRMETCCRSSVVFLEKVPSLPSCEQPIYSDILASAAQFSIFYIAPLILNPIRQSWLNKSDTPYYHCPYTSVVYEEFVRYETTQASVEQSEEISHENEQQRRAQHRRSYQQTQKRNEGSAYVTQNRPRRFGNGNHVVDGGSGRMSNHHNGGSNNNGNDNHQHGKNRQINRRFHRNDSNNNGSQSHQPNRNSQPTRKRQGRVMQQSLS